MTDVHLIIPIGTQVVLLEGVKVLNEDRFQPKGTVGKISVSPADSSHAYKIEFPDGTEGMANRRGFSIRKNYQKGQIKGEDDFQENELFDHVIYRCIVGSRAFGLDDENSDTDRRGIYLPPASLQWGLFGLPEQIEKKESEECYWELQKFLILALKANPNILECLYTPLVEFADETARELLSIREVFLSKLIYQTYNGYVMSQFKKLEQDLRSLGEIRWKHAMHLIRLLLQGIDILRRGDLIVSMEDRRERLLSIKKGELNWEQVNRWRLDLHRDFESAYAATKLPERPDYAAANRFLIEARRSRV
ncbi:MAG: nucleotidyltransferase domain-containing protein [Pyrinomonadaceae bacterium]